MTTDPHTALRSEDIILDDRYVLRELIGRGGMGAVHRAEDRLLGRTVAVKIFAGDPDASVGSERERSEVSALASLNHPALVTLFDANLDARPSPYLVMEFVDGPSLAARMSSGPLPAADVARLLIELSDALCVVHGAGIVHRDVKPSNVLLARGTAAHPFRAKLADFGIAQLADATRLTVPGTFMGTAAYIAPEIVENAAPAPPADIYSLGLVALECLTGVRAFPGTPAESISARLHGEPAIPQSVPVALRALLAAMIARDPVERPTATELHRLAVESERALESESLDAAETTAPLAPTATEALPQPSSSAGTPSPRVRRPLPRRRALALGGMALVIALAGTAASVALSAPDEPTRRTLPAMDEPMSTHFEQLFEAVTP